MTHEPDGVFIHNITSRLEVVHGGFNIIRKMARGCRSELTTRLADAALVVAEDRKALAGEEIAPDPEGAVVENLAVSVLWTRARNQNHRWEGAGTIGIGQGSG